MKIISSTVLVALFAVSQGRFLDATNPVLTGLAAYGAPAYNNALNCGQCIGSGHTYCIQKAENTMTNSYQTGNSQQLCVQSGTSDTKQTDGTWSCSNAFTDRVYSKYVCQYNTAACGVIGSQILLTTNSTANFTVAGLATGQTCFYKVQSACGGPSFKPNDTTRVEIEYVEFKDADLTVTDAVRGYILNSNDTAKRASAPVTGMPRRDHFFWAALGGNQVSGANQTTYVNTTVHGSIFGRSGRFDKLNAGRKAFGNPTQGDTQLSNTTVSTELDCQSRSLYIAVTAIVDVATVRLDLSSVAFYRASNSTSSGANFLSMTIAAVVGLISLALF